MPSTTIRLGEFEVDFEAGELHKQGQTIKLQEKPFRILQILLERPGRVVSRETLFERLWPPDTFVDFDNSVNAAMNKLRAALGDPADEPRYIETLAGRGYRYIGPSDCPADPNHADPAGRGTPSERSPRRPPSL